MKIIQTHTSDLYVELGEFIFVNTWNSLAKVLYECFSIEINLWPLLYTCVSLELFLLLLLFFNFESYSHLVFLFLKYCHISQSFISLMDLFIFTSTICSLGTSLAITSFFHLCHSCIIYPLLDHSNHLYFTRLLWILRTHREIHIVIWFCPTTN